MDELCVGLCEGRHEIPGVDTYIFPEGYFMGSQVFDYARMAKRIHEVLGEHRGPVRVYVTGLTAALVEVINYCSWNLLELKLMHFDRESGSYIEQPVCTNIWKSALVEGDYVSP